MHIYRLASPQSMINTFMLDMPIWIFYMFVGIYTTIIPPSQHHVCERRHDGSQAISKALVCDFWIKETIRSLVQVVRSVVEAIVQVVKLLIRRRRRMTS